MRRLNLSFVLGTALLPLILAGCKPGYSPNTYASTAAQEEASVQRGQIIGVRQVMIAANGAIGAATGGAAGGVAGAQVASGPVGTALGAIGGTLVGGIGGTAAAQAVSSTKGWEYIVQESGDKLVSVTQTSKTPLAIGLHVLVISDAQQARIVPDYTVQVATAAPSANATKPVASDASTVEMNIGPLPPAPAATDPIQLAPVQAASDPATPATPAPANPAPAPPAPTSTPASTPAGPTPATPAATPPGPATAANP